VVPDSGQGVDEDPEWAVQYYRRATIDSHPDEMYNVAQCLEYGKGIDEDPLRAAKYYRLSPQLKNVAAQNSLGICQKSSFATQYCQRAMQ
jgi:TPR repeat protein